ncbi:MAG: spore maturation protein [Ignavibacteriales bacterium]|nr:spore maturation protein [Ignavibacteriales bacterium]MCF8314691.1 spore maturation protein [Ignavibacteriales bacterium]MCF8436272.1 spore maturation protein [Ignavibacteriales bacterium]
MLNYVWLALIILGIGIAITTDISDKVENKYRNGDKLAVHLILKDSENTNKTGIHDAVLAVKSSAFNDFYSEKTTSDITHDVTWSYDSAGSKINVYMFTGNTTPAIWKKMAQVSGKDNDLMGSISEIRHDSSGIISGKLSLEEISFIKMKEVTNSALDYAGTAVEIALGLIGIMALWLGVMKVAEEAGLINLIARAVRPITKKLFPEVPYDHPAMGSMIMNISANMLGLGNAATPFGLKAMEELNTLNDKKDTATNSMCTFLAINTAGLTMIPATAIAVRASAGSSDPAIIIGTSMFGAICATTVGITAAKIFEKFPLKKPVSEILSGFSLKGIMKIFAAAAILIAIYFVGGFGLIRSGLSSISIETLRTVIQIISILAIPMLIFVFITYGAVKKVKIYEVFVEGAKEGFNVAIRIIPYLVAMLVAIGIFRAGGGMDFLIIILQPFTELIGMPAEALPMALMRPLSGSGSLGIMAEIIAVHGPDSFIGIMVSTFFGSTETTFYVLAVYFGSINIKKTRHALAAGLLADIAGIIAAVFIVRQLFLP